VQQFHNEPSLPEQNRIWERLALNDPRYYADPDLQLIERIENIAPRLRQALDLGCGWGRNLPYLIARGWRVTGLDWSQEALDLARAGLRAEGLHATLTKCDMRSLPYQQGQFHLVTATNVLQHGRLADFKRVLLEIRRVAAIGATVVISVPSVRSGPIVMGGNWLEEGTLVLGEGDEAGIPHHFFTLRELEDATRGLRSVVIDTVQQPFPSGYEKLYPEQINEWFWLTLTT
jgi:SAM-dependent methyltransferase